MTTTQSEVAEMLKEDARVVRVRFYRDGFIARSSKKSPTGRAVDFTREGDRTEVAYDRRRTNGRGPRFVAYSERNGVLASS